MRHQRAQFGAEQQRAVEHRPIERLDPEPVAHQAQRAGLPVEQREGEHADKARDRLLRSPFDAGRQHDFGVGSAVGSGVRAPASSARSS